MSNFVVGIDIGGTKIAAGVIDSSARVLARYISKTHAEQPPDDVIAATVEAFHAVLAQAGLQPGEVAGLGVGFGGHVNGAAGLILTSSNLPAWDNHPLRDHLQARLGVPVILENDSNCAAWGEYRFGAGQGSRYLCYVTFSTGYGLAACRRGTNNGPPANETMYIFAGRPAQKWVRTLWTVQKHAFSHPSRLSIRLGHLHFWHQACG